MNKDILRGHTGATTSEISQTLNYDGSVFFTGTSSYNIPPLTDVREYLQQAETTKNRIERSTYLSALFNIPTEPKSGSTIFFPYLDFMT